MDKLEASKYFGDFFRTAGTPGWKTLMEDLADVRNEVNRIDTCKDEQEFWKRQGRLQQLDYLLNYETLMEQAQEQQQIAED